MTETGSSGLIRHGGRKVSDYLVFNTDHKVIGIQYLIGVGQLRGPPDARRRRHGFPEAQCTLVLAADTRRRAPHPQLHCWRRGERLDGVRAAEPPDFVRANTMGYQLAVHRLLLRYVP